MQRSLMLFMFLYSLYTAFFLAVFLNALFVFVYNRYLAMMHESSIKKVVALAGLPMGSILGLLVGIGIFADWFSQSMVVMIQFLVFLGVFIFGSIVLKNTRLKNASWANSRVEVLNFSHFHTAGPVNTAFFSWLSQLVLSAFQPFNQVGCLQVHRVKLTKKELPGIGSGWNGRKILHLTDWHLHSTLHPRWTEFLFSVINREEPDVILFGGDFLSKYQHVQHVEIYLEKLKAPLGVFYVRGNHDFWKSPCRLGKLAQKAGWQLLSNQRVNLTSNGDPLALLGFEIPYVPLTTAEELLLSASHLPNNIPTLALVHTPEAYAKAAQCGAHIALAGHTHGGQIRLPLLGTTICGCAVPRAWADGCGAVGPMLTWTSRGVGAFFPLRLNCAPELFVFQLDVKS